MPRQRCSLVWGGARGPGGEGCVGVEHSDGTRRSGMRAPELHTRARRAPQIGRSVSSSSSSRLSGSSAAGGLAGGISTRQGCALPPRVARPPHGRHPVVVVVTVLERFLGGGRGPRPTPGSEARGPPRSPRPTRLEGRSIADTLAARGPGHGPLPDTGSAASSTLRRREAGATRTPHSASAPRQADTQRSGLSNLAAGLSARRSCAHTTTPGPPPSRQWCH